MGIKVGYQNADAELKTMEVGWMGISRGWVSKWFVWEGGG